MNLLDILQAASNAAASTVTGPVDMLGWGLRKAGLPVPEDAVGSTAWAKKKGLLRDVEDTGSRVVGETLGLLSPAVVAAKAPQIAGGLLKMGENAAAPSTMGKFGQRGVVPVSFVREQGKAASLPTDDVFTQAVANTPGARIEQDGLLMRVQRNQVPDQGMRPSVRGGVFYLPEGAAQSKHYSTGKNGYGGSERIAGETLIQNPMFVKGATGGKAPEAAFDALNGKGAYQSMRSEALKTMGYGTPTWQKAERVDEFLSVYAPELKGMGEYIVRNSSQGNQLAYALQEAAVGSSVRKAGKDAVIGYSKQRSGAPFLSELFDVRERVYPDKFGGFGVWGEP